MISQFKFDILSTCTNALGCPEGGPTASITDWEVFYAGGGFGSPGFQPIPPVGNAGTILIRVFRTSGGLSCDNYTLTVSN